jgi:hypothetical protein
MVGRAGAGDPRRRLPAGVATALTLLALLVVTGRPRRATPTGDPGPEALVATSDALWLLQPAGGLLRLDPGRL